MVLQHVPIAEAAARSFEPREGSFKHLYKSEKCKQSGGHPSQQAPCRKNHPNSHTRVNSPRELRAFRDPKCYSKDACGITAHHLCPAVESGCGSSPVAFDQCLAQQDHGLAFVFTSGPFADP